MVRSFRVLAAALAVAGVGSWSIGTCLLQSLRVGTTAPLASETVANLSTAAADSSCLRNDRLFGCSFGRFG